MTIPRNLSFLAQGASSTGVLGTANGGTNLTSFTVNGIPYATSTSALATNSSLTFDGGGLNIAPTSGAWSLFIASPYSASTSAASVYNGYGSITGSNPQFFVGQRFSSQGKLSFWRYDGGHQANDLTIFNTGGVSIGNTTDPGSSNLSLNQGLFQGSTSPTQRGTMYGVININNNSADGTVDFTQGLVFTDNVNGGGAWTHAGICTTGSSGYNGNLIFGTDNNGAVTNSITEKMRISASGGVSIGNTTDAGAGNLLVNKVVSVGGATPTTSGAGITFPATQSPSSNVNTLDDYKEGTFTPTDGSGASLSITVNYANYTKIGRLVTYEMSVTYPTTANTNSASLTSFPFSCTNNFNGKIIYTAVALATVSYLSSNTTNLFFLSPGVNTTNAQISGSTFIIAGSYIA